MSHVEGSSVRLKRGTALAAATLCSWLLFGFAGLLAYEFLVQGPFPEGIRTLNLPDMVSYIAIGFAAQMVDGALGMGYGVLASSLLIAAGLPPTSASTSVHIVESFTSGASGISHAYHDNVDWRLFAVLVIPGVVGGAAGALVLTALPVEIARPLVLLYLAIIGLVLLIRGLIERTKKAKAPRWIKSVALLGGFFDAAGGGGWGPIVAGNLLLQRADPRLVVGTVNLCEFFVTVSVAALFVSGLGIAAFSGASLGLLIGGLVAAPFAARLTRLLKPRMLLVLIGALLIATSALQFALTIIL